MSEQQLLKLIELTYESALNPLQWPEFLKALAEAAQATHTAIKIFDFQDMANSLPAHFGFSPETLKGFEEYWGAQDICFHHARGIFAPMSARKLVAWDVRDTTEIYVASAEGRAQSYV